MAARGGQTEVVHNLQAYKRHITSEFLADRYPYLEDIRGHLKHDDVSMAYGARLFPRLVEQLKTPSMAPEKLVEALRTVCDLCSHQESKCQAIASDVVAAATNLLLHDSIPVRRDAARVISSIALMLSGRSVMPAGSSSVGRRSVIGAMHAATLPRLAKLLLSCDDDLVKMHTADALRAVTVFRDGCQQVVDQGTAKGIAQYLCATLPDLPDTCELARCLLHLLYALAAVSMYANEGLRDLLGVGLVARMVGLLGHVLQEGGVPAAEAEDATDIVRQVLRVLWHCGNDAKGRREVLKAGGVEVVTSFLNHPDAKVREAAVCALNVVALETHGKQDVLEHSKESMAQLLRSTEETPYLHETCIQLCRCASELPAFRFAFARHILDSVWLLDKIYGTPAIAAVGPLLAPKEDPATRTRAAEVLQHFLQTKPSPGDLIRVPPVCPLSNISDPTQFAAEEVVDVVANLVDLLSVARDPALACLDALTDARQPRSELMQLIRDGRVTVPEAVASEVGKMLQKV